MTVYGALPLEDERPRLLYPLAGALPDAPMAVEVNLGFTHVVRRYYTQRQGTCVAFSACEAMTFVNGRLYHPGWSFFKSGGDPNYGTHTDPLMNILRTEGNLAVPPPYPDIASEDDVRHLPGDIGEGIKEFRWLSGDGAQALQDLRTTLSLRVPALLAFPVYGATPQGPRTYWDVPEAPRPTGWHQVCVTYISDAEGIVGSPNSYGDGPLYCFTYEAFVRLINTHHAYGVVITDNITGTEGAMPADPTPMPPTPDPTFACPVCGREFPTKRRMRRHRRRMHG